jgi:hypothetical protein
MTKITAADVAVWTAAAELRRVLVKDGSVEALKDIERLEVFMAAEVAMKIENPEPCLGDGWCWGGHHSCEGCG